MTLEGRIVAGAKIEPATAFEKVRVAAKVVWKAYIGTKAAGRERVCRVCLVARSVWDSVDCLVRVFSVAGHGAQAKGRKMGSERRKHLVKRTTEERSTAILEIRRIDAVGPKELIEKARAALSVGQRRIFNNASMARSAFQP